MIYKEEMEKNWFEIPLVEQLANIGMEVLRAIKWKKRDEKYFNKAIEKAINLIDLTKNDPKNRKRVKEICRLKEVLIDYFWGKNEYKSTDQAWEKYFNSFIYYSGKLREKRRMECQK